MREILKNAYDLHVHVAPDVIPRKCDDRELAQRIQSAGMKGCVIKCHYFETASRAALLQKEFPAFRLGILPAAAVESRSENFFSASVFAFFPRWNA